MFIPLTQLHFSRRSGSDTSFKTGWENDAECLGQQRFLGRVSLILNLPSLESANTVHRPPSTNDVYMHIQYIIIYFNTTASEAGQDADFNEFCSFAGGPDAKGTICYITDKGGVPSLDSAISLDPPVSDTSNRSKSASMPLLAMLIGGSMFFLL